MMPDPSERHLIAEVVVLLAHSRRNAVPPPRNELAALTTAFEAAHGADIDDLIDAAERTMA